MCMEEGIENLTDIVAYKVYFWCSGLWFLGASFGFLLYGLKVHVALQSVLHQDPAQTQVLIKLTVVIAICFCCFLLRFIMLLLLFINQWEEYHTDFLDKEEYFLLWNFASQFLPYFGLFGTMLYITRRPDDFEADNDRGGSLGGGGGGGSVQSDGSLNEALLKDKMIWVKPSEEGGVDVSHQAGERDSSIEYWSQMSNMTSNAKEGKSSQKKNPNSYIESGTSLGHMTPVVLFEYPPSPPEDEMHLEETEEL